MPRLSAISLIPLLFLTIPSPAQDIVKANVIAACRVIQDSTQRLACYDKIFSLPPANAEDSTLLPKPLAAVEKPVSLMIDNRWELNPESKKGQFRLLPYKPVFILAAFHSTNVNDQPNTPNEDTSVLEPLGLSATETKFQLSLKSKLWQNVIGDYSDLWFGYTQSSRWQVFNAKASRPFRENGLRTGADVGIPHTLLFIGVAGTHDDRRVQSSIQWPC